MIEYSKIETLFDRDPEYMKHVLYGQYRLPEFIALRDAPIWHISEKIDGTNIRVHYDGGVEAGGNRVRYGGRTDNAQMPAFLLDMLQEKFPPKLFESAFDLAGPGAAVFTCTLFGEGYGPKVQSGGWYRGDAGFRLFDVRIGDWWLEWDNVVDVANKLGCETVPVLARGVDIGYALSLVEEPSVTANLETGRTDRVHEGVVARTEPMLFTRKGERLMWKLKVRDLAGEYRKLQEALV